MSAGVDEPWELTRLLSPRGSVRVDAESGNDYGLTHDVDDDAPAAPWAMYLAGDDGRYWYLCFDLDAKNGNAAYDAGRLSHWLDELNMYHLVCVSGPTGGRHVWLPLAESAPAETVATIADYASQLLPSLDRSPLSNPRTGCVRPPFTPHRAGGRSEPQAPVDALLEHGVTLDELDALQAFLIDAGAMITPPAVSLVKGMATTGGHPHLTGAKRDPSTRIRALLNTSTEGDTSRTQAAVLVGCARARWRYTDMLALLDSAPALEHSRSRPTPGGRVQRPRRAAEKLLAADWSRAVYFAAQNPLEREGDDEDFLARATATSEAVAAAQARADASPGRWGLAGASRAQRGAQGRPSHRAVLDAVSLYLVQAARDVVEVDTRRLAADTGYSAEACRMALNVLATPDVDGEPESAWLVRVEAADGIHGGSYRLSTRFSTEAPTPEWAQAATRPPGAASRTWWITQLGSRLQALAHDAFSAPGSLGRTAGRIYRQLLAGAVVTVAELATAAGMTASQTVRALRRLHRAGLVERSSARWHRSPTVTCDQAAAALQVDGYLAERRVRYEIQRGRWAWWSAECQWLRKARKKRRGRRAPAGVALFAQNDRPDFPRYPRTHTGRPDHIAAYQLIDAGVLEPYRIDKLAA